MLDLYGYLTRKQHPKSYLNGVYLCTGSSVMEELMENIRSTEFPCVVVEIGDEGWFDMLTSDVSGYVVTFYILEKKDNAKTTDIRDILNRTKLEGKRILRQMRTDACEYGDECFGIDFSRIDYFKVGPIALGAYGYCFNLTMVEQ